MRGDISSIWSAPLQKPSLQRYIFCEKCLESNPDLKTLSLSNYSTPCFPFICHKSGSWPKAHREENATTHSNVNFSQHLRKNFCQMSLNTVSESVCHRLFIGQRLLCHFVCLLKQAACKLCFGSRLHLCLYPELLHRHHQRESLVGKEVVVVTATDLDKGSNGIFSYRLVHGDSQRQFEVDPRTGRITLVKSLDREMISNYGTCF